MAKKSFVTGVPSFQHASTCRNVLYKIIFAQDRIFTDGHKESDLRDECKATFLGQMDRKVDSKGQMLVDEEAKTLSAVK